MRAKASSARVVDDELALDVDQELAFVALELPAVRKPRRREPIQDAFVIGQILRRPRTAGTYRGHLLS
jgi:hypothetical protein